MRFHDTLSASTAFARLIVCVEFALVAGLPLSWPYLLYLLHFCGGTHTFVQEDAWLNQVFSLVLNCFIVALNPWLYCMFQAWALMTYWPLRAADCGHMFEAVGPLLAYCIYAARKGWMETKPNFQLDATCRKKVILVALLVASLMPFGQQILNAPTNMRDSFRLLNLSMRNERDKNSCEGHFAVDIKSNGKATTDASSIRKPAAIP